MEPALILAMIILGWLSVALAMLWGMMRIARRHHPPQARPAKPRPLAASAEPNALPSWHA
ncbi:hypothetical protein CXK93_21425 [Stutzerimonas decontaminans]|uniref:Uncharacterized protein n=1 Tax=Stutzerimonas decontaminans TaxID=3022791 RepID=A0ABX4VRT4_9GAMM|nr:hypothetical protein [Stutzerimonas decontaminans]MCQ4246993.1 hypothetical protein [Stutzerimonas decontaminans]PNF82890.1 hypothetical protein CXK93_21425 [Stutzerimonas decontaminans]